MSRRVIIVALVVVVASLTGFQYAPAETQEKIHQQFSIVQDLMAVFYTWCSQQPYVILAKERLSSFVTSFTDKLSKAGMNPTAFSDAKAYTHVKYLEISAWAAMNFPTTDDAKAFALMRYAEIATLARNSTTFADAKAYAVLKYSAISTLAGELSFVHMLLLIGSSFLLVIVLSFWQCRRKVHGVMATTAAAHSHEVPLECQTETPANVMPLSSSVPHRRRNRCDSPGPVGNEENEAPQTNFKSTNNEEFLHKVNTATDEELLAFPGLGGKSVEKILKYRSKHGEIQDFEELIAKVGLSKVTVSKVAKLHRC